jgi:NH3-dependent NAD+ synthetase
MAYGVSGGLDSVAGKIHVGHLSFVYAVLDVCMDAGYLFIHIINIGLFGEDVNRSLLHL